TGKLDEFPAVVRRQNLAHAFLRETRLYRQREEERRDEYEGRLHRRSPGLDTCFQAKSIGCRVGEGTVQPRREDRTVRNGRQAATIIVISARRASQSQHTAF